MDTQYIIYVEHYVFYILDHSLKLGMEIHGNC